MTAREALAEGARGLGAAGTRGGTASPFLDASLLLARALGLSREALFGLPDDPLPESAIASYRGLLGRRAAGEPVAYILGRREFLGRPFICDRRALVPRPETEMLVLAALDWALALPERERASVHECCAGSGCAILSLAMELGERLGGEGAARFALSASDVSREALSLAAENAAALGGAALDVELLESDLLSSAPGPFDLVMANPPYVDGALAAVLSRDSGEPVLALDGGPDGLSLYRRLLPECLARLSPQGLLLLEIGDDQGEALSDLLNSAGFRDVTIHKDLAGQNRLARARRA